MDNLTPRQIVAELDRYIVGQAAAKRAVAIAIRNRWRRQQLSEELRNEVTPKNIIMIGPTGVGKTEIARRLALLTRAPFLKVEASKFTEVGYVGRDVESMVRELADVGVNLVRNEFLAGVREKAQAAAETRLLDLLLAQHFADQISDTAPPASANPTTSPAAILKAKLSTGKPDVLFSFLEQLARGSVPGELKPDHEPGAAALTPGEPGKPTRDQMLARLRQQLSKGELDSLEVELTVTDNQGPSIEFVTNATADQLGFDLQGMLERLVPSRNRQRKFKTKEALKVLVSQESEKFLDRDKVQSEAKRRVEQSGIIFVDEIDKLITPGGHESHGPQISREGVQRDLLPIVEGSTVNTRIGPVRTEHVLFIAAGAFEGCSPSDLIPELQGRFPIRVELTALTRADFVRILKEPQNALIKQYQALLKADGIDLQFTQDGIEEIARVAEQVNAKHQNIGARRLHTILERLLDDIAFQAPEIGSQRFMIDREAVVIKLSRVVEDDDLSKFVL